MSYENFQKALEFLFPSEGGYSNHKNDKGGATNMGITQNTYNAYRKQKNIPIKDVKNITKNEAIKIYYENYWLPSGADKINDSSMSIALFDTAVLHGPTTAKKYYNQSNGNLEKFLNIRKRSYDKIVEKDPSQKIFYKGWNNRVENLRKYTSDLNKGIKNDNTTNAKRKNKVLYGGITYEQLNEKTNYINEINEMYQELLNEQSNENLIYTREMIGKMTADEYLQNEPMIMEQLKTQGGIPSEKQLNQQNDLSGFINQISGNSNIFTREDIKNMSADEYLKNEKAIDFQLKTIGIPSQVQANQAVQSGGMIYVQPYTRADGTGVRGYYRAR